jgi:hypothetical protein
MGQGESTRSTAKGSKNGPKAGGSTAASAHLHQNVS